MKKRKSARKKWHWGILFLVFILSAATMIGAWELTIRSQEDFSPSISIASAATVGLWISQAEIDQLPTSGPAWNAMYAAAQKTTGVPDLSNQEDPVNVRVMAKALVCARKNEFCADVVEALRSIVTGTTEANSTSRALSVGRELAAYVISADIINLASRDAALDAAFRSKIKYLLTYNTPGGGGPANILDCFKTRPNNWGAMCGASVIAIDRYLNDVSGVAEAAKIFHGWLGDRTSYAGFTYGDTSWQCDATKPVGINPLGCVKDSHNFNGILPDDLRRGGSYSATVTWPPFHENYVYEALQGAVTEAELLSRAGYDVWNWQDKALKRAYDWLNVEDNFSASGDDTWSPYLIDYHYGTHYATVSPSTPGKNVGWTDWTTQATTVATVSTPSVSLIKTSNVSQAVQGQEITYTIQYINNGQGVANNVVIKDKMPANCAYVANSASNSASFSSIDNELTWNVGQVAAGASGSVTFRMTVNQAAPSPTSVNVLSPTNGGSYVSGSRVYKNEGWSNGNDGDISDTASAKTWAGTITAYVSSNIYTVYSFSSPKTISKIRLLTDTGVGYSNRWLKNFKLEIAATDTGSYTTVLTGTKAQLSGFEEFTFTPVKAKRVRITAGSNYGDPRYLQIGEIEIYGY